MSDAPTPISPDDDEPQGAPPPGPDETPEKRLGRRVTARRVALAGTGIALLLLVAIAGVYAYLQTDAGRERLRGVAVAQIANLLADDATVSVEALDGNFLSGARLVGFKVERGGETVLAIDTLRVRYTLRTLLNRTFAASALTVVGPRLVVRQRADGTFNTTGLLKPAADTTKAPFTVLVDDMNLRDGRAEVHWYNPDRDSTITLADVNTRVRDFVSSADSLNGRIADLRLGAIATDRETRMDVSGAGRFSRSEVVLTRLAAESTNGTRLSGSARAGFGETVRAGDALPVFEADLAATPFALADARAFAGASLYGDPRVRLSASSDGGTLTASLRGSLEPDGGGPQATFALDGEMTRATDGPVRYRAEGELRRFNPAALTRNPALDADLTGELSTSLEGSSLRALDGPFRVALRESKAAGRQIDRLTLDGRFASGRVTFDVDGAIPGLDLVAAGDARPFDRIPTFAARGRARDVNLGVLLPGQGISGRLTGDVAVEGRGTALDTFFGTAALGLGRTDVTVGGKRYLFDSVDLDADIQGGFAGYDADVVLGQGGGRLVAAGTVDPRGETLEYVVDRGRLERFNLAALTGNPAQASSLTGTFSLDGAGTDPQTLRLDATAALRGSRFGTTDIRSADVDARLRRGALNFDAAADLGAIGALTAAGTAQPFGQPISYNVRGTTTRLDVAAVTSNPALASNLTGAYEITGRGIDPQTLTVDARVQLRPSTFGERLIDATDLRLSLRQGQASLAGSLDTPDGQFTFDAGINPFAATPTIRLAEGTCFASVDAGRLTGNASLSTNLSGCAQGTVSGYQNLETASADLAVTLRPSRVNAARIQDARANVTLRDGALAGTLDATLAEADLPPDTTLIQRFPPDGTGGTLRAAFQGRPFDATPSYAVRGRTRGLDVAAAMGLGGASVSQGAARRTNLSLDFDLSGRGTDPRTMRLDGSVSALPSAVGAIRIDTLDADFALAAGVLHVDTLSVRSNLARADGGGTVALFDPNAASDFRLAGAIESLDGLGLDTPLTLQRGEFDLTAIGIPGQPLSIAGTLDADRIAYGETSIDNLDGTLSVSVDRAALDSLGVDALSSGAVEGSAAVSFSNIETASRTLSQGRLTATLQDVPTGTAVALTAFAVLDERRDIDLAAVVELPAPAAADSAANPFVIRLDAARASVDTATWTLARPTTITVGDGLAVDSLLIVNDTPQDGRQRLLADGRVRFSGDQDFTFAADQIDLSLLSDLAGLNNLGGDAAVTLRVTGTAEAPLIDGSLGVRDLSSGGEPVGAIDATFRYADGEVGLDGAVTHVAGQRLTFNGTVPRRLSLDGGFALAEALPTDEVRFVARADSFPIAWARPFLDPEAYTDLGGALALDLTVTGTQTDPRLAGTASLRDGRLGVAATGLVYDPISADIAFAQNRVEIQRALIGEPAATEVVNGETVRGGDGLDVTGVLTLQSLSLGELDLTIAPREWTAIDTPTFRRLVLGAGDTPLRLTGTLAAPVLRGSVVLSKGDVYLTDELVPPDLEEVELSDEDIAVLEQRFGRIITEKDTTVNRFTQALDYDLNVVIDRNVWIRSEAGVPFDIEFAGEVDARKAAFAEESELFGTIRLTRGEIQTLSRRFQIDRGTLVFNGTALGARVDIQSSADIKLSQSFAGQSAVTVLLNVNGELDDNPEVRLSSDPALDPADIVSLIATGQLAGQGGGGGSLGGTGTSIASSVASGIAEGLVNESLGLDLTQVDIAPDGSVIIKVGKYLTNRFFLTAGYVTGRSAGASRAENEVPIQVTLDYVLYQWLQAQTEYSGQRGVGGGVNAQIAF